jgi:hypothetical protein
MQHEWLIFANAIAHSQGGESSVLITAVCKRCGEVRSSLSSVEGNGQIDLTGKCSGTGPSEPPAAFG